MATCKVCKKESPFISNTLGLCLQCIRTKPEECLYFILLSHRQTRFDFGLPTEPPCVETSQSCRICVNECKIQEGEYGYCGIRKNEKGKIIAPSSEYGKLSWYIDPIPTNCVADWVCAAHTGAGYPQYAYSKTTEHGFYNLAVFFQACSFNCLYCQNWHFREETFSSQIRHVSEILKTLSPCVSCICFFGGDPTPQIPFALRFSRLTTEQKKGRVLRICWETNGSMHKSYLEKMIELSLKSGGTIKFDLKAWNETLHIALTGISNKRTLENFAYAAQFAQQRPNPPLVIASTPIVPGYIDEKEIKIIATFIASINPQIPYRLLAFYPTFYMSDTPFTPKKLAYQCYEAAIKAGLKNVSIGNQSLLS